MVIFPKGNENHSDSAMCYLELQMVQNIQTMKLTDGVVRAFKPAKIFRDNTDKINHIDYTANGDTLITSSADDSIVIYDCFDGK